MTIEEIKDIMIRQLKYIAPEINFDEIRPDDNLREELDIDSIDWLNFLVAIDKETGVEIPEADYELLDTLEHTCQYIYNATPRQ